jgi:glycerophosphoryl diester phosphodiesterase
MKKQELDIQGHRGCRGLLPENTLVAFQKSLELGVTTLELDVVVSADSQLVVSHEPWFNSEITSALDGSNLDEQKGKKLNLFQLNYAEIKLYDVGKKVHPRFLKQKKIPAVKPLLRDVFVMAENYCKEHSRPQVRYNIEIKSSITDEKNGYQPTVSAFCELLMFEIYKHNLANRCAIQSFDVRVLKYMHKHFPQQNLVYLVEQNSDYNAALRELNFLPQVYSCDYSLLSEEKVKALQDKSMKVIPWTVNNKKDMQILMDWGVDGFITDYPDSALELISN